VGRPEGEPQWHGRRLPGAAAQKVGSFCLPGFVEDRGQIYFSRRDSFLVCATQERDRGKHRKFPGQRIRRVQAGVSRGCWSFGSLEVVVLLL
jgi:hypothetical protein